MFCNLKENTKNDMVKQGLINSANKILDLVNFRSYNDFFSQKAKEKYNVTNSGKMFNVEEKQIAPLKPSPYNRTDGIPIYFARENKEFFDELQQNYEEQKSNSLLQLEGAKSTEANKEILDKVKDSISKMGISMQTLAEYAKSTRIDVKGVNGLADLIRGVIAIAEQKDGVALTEEYIHIATAMIEQLHPEMISQMISQIGNYKIYDETFKEYKDLYKLPNGKPDIRRIKKEAYDKLITEIFVNKLENKEYYPELKDPEVVNKVQSVWNWILEKIRSIYRKANTNIFEDVASKIINDVPGNIKDLKANGVYYSVSKEQENIQKALENTDDNIEKVTENSNDPLLLDDSEANNFYKIKDENGEWIRIKKRVTDRVKAWYAKKFGNKKFTKEEQEFNELKRTWGTRLHGLLEETHNRYFHNDGTKRDVPTERISKEPELQELYDKLETYYSNLIETFKDKETGELPLIFAERIVYSKKEKEAGTIDFFAVNKNGKAHILDWKFMTVGKNSEDVPWFKQGAYGVQLGRYKQILQEDYGVKSFGRIQAIPFLMDFSFNKETNKASLKGISMGSVNQSEIEDLRLLPISEASTSTGNENLDKAIDTLNKVLNEISGKSASSEEEREFKIERLNTLRKAIRIVQGQGDVKPIVDAIQVMRREGDNIINDYNIIFKDNPSTSNDFNNEQLSEFSERMIDYVTQAEAFKLLDVYLADIVYNPSMEKEATTPEEKQFLQSRKTISDNLRKEVFEIRKSIAAIKGEGKNKGIQGEFADKHIGEKNLVAGLLKAEKIVRGMASNFRSVSELGLRSLQLLFKLTNLAKGKASQDSAKDVEKLMEIRKALKAKGGDIRKLVQQLYQKNPENGNIINKLIYKYSKEFYDTLKEKAEKGGDAEWLKENIDLEAYKKEANEIMNRNIADINKRAYAGEEADVEKFRKEKIEEEKRKWDVENKNFDGWDNYVLKRHPLDKWHSEEFNKIKSDPDLFKLYNWITETNQKAKEIGYIQNRVSSTFLPFVHRSDAERLTWDGDVLSVIKGWGDGLKMRAEDVGYGKINELSKKLENSIPKYYTHDFTYKNGVNDYSDVSEDLFKNLILYNEHVNKYKYLSEVEGQIKLLKTIEESKNHLSTTADSKILFDENGVPKEEAGNEQNTKILDDFTKVLLYEQRYPLSPEDTPINIGKTINSVKNIVNKLAGKEIWKKSETPTALSLNKCIDATNRAMRLKTLGFNPVSSVVSFFSHNIQLTTQAGNYFNGREILKNEAKLLSMNFDSESDKEMFVQLINTFTPLDEDPSKEAYKEAGMTKLTNANVTDMLMVMMRKPEAFLRKVVFLSLLDNMMVKDGKIVSIPEYVKSKYEGRNKSAQAYKESKLAIQKEIDELKKTSSLSAIKKLNEKGELEIPGLDLNNREQTQRLTELSKRISRNASGNMSSSDISKMELSIWTRSMMVFHNWIPKLLDTRFSEFRKTSDDFSTTIDENGLSQGDKYEIGRIRLLANIWGDNVFKKSSNLISILRMTDKGLNAIDNMYDEFAKSYEKRNGEPLNMSREDFVDLIHKNIRKQIQELAILATLMGTAYAFGMIGHKKHETKDEANRRNYTLKLLDRFSSELTFFYNPAEFQKLLKGGIFPAMGIVTDFSKFAGNLTEEITGFDMSHPEKTSKQIRKDAKPVKTFFRMLPATRLIETFLGVLSDKTAKEFGITIHAHTNIE